MTRTLGSLTRGGLLTVVLLAGLADLHAQEDGERVYGLWSGGDSLLDIQPDGDGLSMTIVAIRNAVYRVEDSVGEPGSPRHDDNNPDPQLRDRPLVGMQLLSEYAWTGRRWEGKVYDPESGNTYSSRLEPDGDRLKMRGYLGVPMLGRTQHFERIETCGESVQELLAASKVDLAFCD